MANNTSHTFYGRIWKPFLGILFALMLLMLLSPLFVLLCITGSIAFRGNPFYLQYRAGMHMRAFRMIKFKSMLPEKNGVVLSDTQRLTRYGRILRASSLDELPQLLHIISGKMAFIGPRPLFLHYLPFYTEEEQIRHTVRPGITGYAQVRGRNFSSWDMRLSDDIYYVQHVSFGLDLHIFFKTISSLFYAKDTVADQRMVMQDLDKERMDTLQIQLQENMRLRFPQASDANDLLVLKNNADVNAMLEGESRTYDLPAIQKWIQEHRNNTATYTLLAEDTAQQKIFGHVALYHIDYVRSFAMYGILIGLPDYRNRGLGERITQKMLDIAREQLGLKHIVLHVLEQNNNAIRMYEKLGFRTSKRYADVDSGNIVMVMQYDLFTPHT